MGQPKPKRIQPRIGAFLAARRKLLGLTQADLADRVDVEYAFIGRLERNEAQGKLELWEGLAAAVGMKLSELLRAIEQGDASMATHAREGGARYANHDAQIAVLVEIAGKLTPRKLATLLRVAHELLDPRTTGDKASANE